MTPVLVRSLYAGIHHDCSDCPEEMSINQSMLASFRLCPQTCSVPNYATPWAGVVLAIDANSVPGTMAPCSCRSGSVRPDDQGQAFSGNGFARLPTCLHRLVGCVFGALVCNIAGSCRMWYSKKSPHAQRRRCVRRTKIVCTIGQPRQRRHCVRL